MHFVDENDDENRLREMEEHDGDNGSGSGGEDEFDAFGSGGGGAQDYREAYSLPLPKARGFSIGKEPIKPITPDNTSSHPHGLKDIAIQTLPLPFSRVRL